MAKLLHIVADYGNYDPAFHEVEQRLLTLYPDFRTISTSVRPFNTVATGFWIYQYALGVHPEGMMIFSNTAPRKDDAKGREENAGEHFIYALLENGVEIVAVNAGFTFSFVRPYIKQLSSLNVANQGSQFRSRDFYPQAAAAIAQGDKSILGHSIHLDRIPEAPTDRIAWVDGYGNIKTTIRKSHVSYKVGEKLQIIIDGVIRTALVSGGSFSVAEGELAFSFGSSGYENPFVELFLRGGNAYKHFGKPSEHAVVEIHQL